MNEKLAEHIQQWIEDYESREEHDGELSVELKDDAYIILKELIK